ncbi:hypothetical protein [Nonomuraea jabiensis]|uniref:hypothetical protein n=1 Tax=Nonomuraea jabiensis TaxID=882448 RepID=UPI003D75C806
MQRDLGMLPAASALADSLETQDARVQKTAEKWLGGITALFGLFSLTGVATGKDALLGLSQGHRWLVATFMLTAVGTAVYAIVMGYLAAYDWVRLIRLDQNDGQLIRFEQNKSGYAARTAGRLQHAVYAALGALSAITVMMLLVWFLPRVA